MSRSENIRNFLRSCGSTIVSVEFMKKDGTIRKILFNPKDRNEIVGTGSKVQNPNIIAVRDLGIAQSQKTGAWRSFDVNRIVSIKSRGQVFNFVTV
jgi:hypothetical protein